PRISTRKPTGPPAACRTARSYPSAAGPGAASDAAGTTTRPKLVCCAISVAMAAALVSRSPGSAATTNPGLPGRIRSRPGADGEETSTGWPAQPARTAIPSDTLPSGWIHADNRIVVYQQGLGERVVVPVGQRQTHGPR